MVRTVEQSRETAELANKYAREFMLQADTHPKFGTLTPEEQQKISRGIADMRVVVNSLSKTSLGVDKTLNRFMATVAASQVTRLGNCGESASLALDYVANYVEDASAEIYQMDPAVDHVFCVIDRAEGSDPKKPETWGPNAFVCDPWSDEVYPASELSKPKGFTFAKTSYKAMPNGSIEASTSNVDVTFDPSKHTIEPQENLNTDYIRYAKSMEHVDSVVDAYQQKSAIVLSALKTFSDDLDQIAKGLDKDKDSISQEKAAVIKTKIAAVQSEISRLEGDIASNMPDRDSYFSVRAYLEQKLRQSVINTRELLQLRQEESLVLDKRKNPLVDKLMGKSSSASSTAINQATRKVNITLEKLADVTVQKRLMQNYKDGLPTEAIKKTDADDNSITPKI